MPTGYTDAIGKGCTFEEFTWSCARAFGALVMMRDERSDARVPERFEPSDYHAKKIAELQAERYDLERLTPEGATAKALAEREEVIARNAEYAAKDERLAVAYRAMLAKIEAWESPSPDHDGLKKFMREQVLQSLDHDCSWTYQEKLPAADGAAWRVDRLAKIDTDLAYHRKHHEEEVARTESRNEWIRQLRASVPQP